MVDDRDEPVNVVTYVMMLIGAVLYLKAQILKRDNILELALHKLITDTDEGFIIGMICMSPEMAQLIRENELICSYISNKLDNINQRHRNVFQCIGTICPQIYLYHY